MTPIQSEHNSLYLAMALITQALEICDGLDLYEAGCHLQMGLDMLEKPETMQRIVARRIEVGCCRDTMIGNYAGRCAR